jgi:hypothetical protein
MTLMRPTYQHVHRSPFALVCGFHLEQHPLVQRWAATERFEGPNVYKHVVASFDRLYEPKATISLPMREYALGMCGALAFSVGG